MKLKTCLLLMIFAIPWLSFAQKTENAEQIVQNYLIKFETPDNKYTTQDYEITLDQLDSKTQVRRIHALQKIDGIYVREGLLTLTFGKNQKLFPMNSFVRRKANTSSPSLNAVSAIRTSMAFHKLDRTLPLILEEDKNRADGHVVYKKGAIAASDIEARLMFIQHKEGKDLRLTWETQLHTPDRQNYWVSYVDAQTGKVLETKDMVLHCSFGEGLTYDASPEEQAQLDARHREMHMESARNWDKMINDRVQHSCTTEHHTHAASATDKQAAAGRTHTYFVLDAPAEAPNDNTATNTQSLVSTAGDPIASPFGWTSTDGVTENTYTKGNNVYAFHDPSPSPLGGAPQPSTAAQATVANPAGSQAFIYFWDLTQEPEYSTTSPNNQFPNRNAAIVNLFYWNNLIHDVFYNFGFTEAGRNFQFDNMGKGGVGNDEVLAQAQDGGGTNNANFLTLTDGVNGQMQMYLWTSSTLDSLVKISTVDIPTTVMGGDKFASIQGALYNSANPIDLNTNPVLDKTFVLVNDGCGNSEGCGAGGGVGNAPCNSVTDAIVLIDRGSCSFAEKVDGAQKGGAAGVIVMNNDAANPDAILAMGGTDPTVNTITIPSVMVSYNTGLLLKSALADGAVMVGSLQQDNPPIPKKDGDFDNGIIAHEYGHGISIRTSPQTATGGSLSGDEQGGEGWADYYALYMTTTQSDLKPATAENPFGVLPDRGIGTYVRYTDYDGPGIRPRKYSVDKNINEYTFAGNTNGGAGVQNAPEITIPHGIGFIWCTMLVEMTQKLVDQYGFNDDKTYNPPVTGDQTADVATLTANNAGNNLALKLIQEGISLQSPSPRFTDMRDGILKADSMLYDAAHSCIIWEAFAERGLGVNSTNESNNIGDEADGYGVPASCNPEQVYFTIKKTVSEEVIENRGNLIYTITVGNTSPSGTAATNVVVTDDLPPFTSIVEVTGAAHTVSNDIITFTIPTIEADASVELTVEVKVNTPATTTIKEDYDFETGAQGWTAVSGGANSFSRVNDPAQAYSGDFYYFTPNTGTGTSGNTTLTSPPLDPNVSGQQLRFWHKFDTDSGFDGGFVEVTSDGITWARMPLQENGYNGALNSTFNPANGGAAFTGTATEYFESAGMIPDGTTQLRFVFSEDTGGGGGDGWWIDDVKIAQNPVTLTNVASVSDPATSGGRTYTSSASTLILARSCDDVNLVYPSGFIPDGTDKYVEQTITISGQGSLVLLLENDDAKLRAGDMIEILSGFELRPGATISIEIENCEN